MASASSITSSASTSLGSLATGGVPTTARFDGKAENFPTFKFNFMAVMRILKLHDTLLKPLPKKRAGDASHGAAVSSVSAALPSAAALGLDASATEEERKAAAAEKAAEAVTYLRLPDVLCTRMRYILSDD